MTRERSEDVLLIAVALSVALHVLLMIYARPRVMASVSAGVERDYRRAPMKVLAEKARTKPLGIDALEDVGAKKTAPQAEVAESAGAPGLESVELAAPAVASAAAAVAELAGEVKPKAEEAHRFREESLKTDERGRAKVVVAEFETPSVPVAGAGGFALEGAPGAFSARPPAAVAHVAPLAVPVPVRVESPVAELPRVEREAAVQSETFTPSKEVFESVDEKIVEREKAAVRELVDAPDAVELEKFVNLAVNARTQGEWTYFKVMITARSSLQTVPKDFVVLIDASGSIGKERIASIKAAARKVLRSAANTGDRFNLVAFRDRYSYAFREWQECTESSFGRADRWISNLAAHGRTDVFATIASVLTLPRTPERPLIALVVTDGEANSGVSSTEEILSRFTSLNDGLVSVYMYGVKASANRELIDTLTRGNRGESFVHGGIRWRAGSGIEGLSERFRDPVLSDIRVVFSSDTAAEAYPLRLKNLYRGDVLELVGRVPAGKKEVAFSLKGLNGRRAHEGFYRLSLVPSASADEEIPRRWQEERKLYLKLAR